MSLKVRFTKLAKKKSGATFFEKSSRSFFFKRTSTHTEGGLKKEQRKTFLTIWIISEFSHSIQGHEG